MKNSKKSKYLSPMEKRQMRGRLISVKKEKGKKK